MKVKYVMKEPTIVLHVVGRMDIGGAESRIMDLYRNIDRNKVQFYFMQHTKDRCAFEEEVESLGGKVYRVPRFNVKNYVAYKKAWEDFFKAHPEIKVVHGHMTSTAAIYLPIAKKAGVEMTIAHARSAGVDQGIKGVLTRILRKNLYRKCDYRFTCSQVAGEAVFGNQNQQGRKADFIPNAIDTDKFVFDFETRNQLRQELEIADKFVIGHVGRFAHMKNHKYMLQILQQCIQMEQEKQTPQAVMMFLGAGEMLGEIKQQAKEMGIASRILFLGNKKDVYRYYQAMDFFLLPSFYEGLPGTAIEAQASGLLGILSDTVTEEAVITELLQRRSIEENPKLWAEEIMSQNWREENNTLLEKGTDVEIQMSDFRTSVRGKYADLVKQASFDVKIQAERMQEFYLKGKLNGEKNS